MAAHAEKALLSGGRSLNQSICLIYLLLFIACW